MIVPGTDLLVHFGVDCIGGTTATWLRCKCPAHRALRATLFVAVGLAASEATIRLVG